MGVTVAPTALRESRAHSSTMRTLGLGRARHSSARTLTTDRAPLSRPPPTSVESDPRLNWLWAQVSSLRAFIIANCVEPGNDIGLNTSWAPTATELPMLFLHEGHRDGLARQLYGQRPAIATLRFRHHRLRPSNAVSSPSAQNHEHRVLHICPPRPPLSRPPPGSSSASFSSGQSTTSWLIVGICLRRPAGSSSSQPPFVGVKLREGIYPAPSHPSGTSSAAHVRLCGSNQDDLSDQQLNSDLNDQQLVSAAHVRLCESNQFGHGQSAPTSAAVLSPQLPCALQPNEDINTCVYPTIACSLAGVGLARCEAGAVSCPHHT